MPSTADVGWLVQASASGDAEAWNELVRRYASVVMAVTRRYRLPPADAQDVSQTVWLRLVENLANLRKPEALPGWLQQTASRECWRHLSGVRRTLPMDPHADVPWLPATAEELDADILRAELRQALLDGVADLPERDQALLRLRAADPPVPYREISRLLDMPLGAVGPTLRRCLDRLRDTSAMRCYLAAAPSGERERG